MSSTARHASLNDAPATGAISAEAAPSEATGRRRPTAVVPAKFAIASDAARAGVLLVAEWATENSLVRTDRPADPSVRWGSSRYATYLWCFGSGHKSGLELWLQQLPPGDAEHLGEQLSEWGAAPPSDPRLEWDVVVDHWQDVQAFLGRYLAAWLAVRPGS